MNLAGPIDEKVWPSACPTVCQCKLSRLPIRWLCGITCDRRRSREGPGRAHWKQDPLRGWTVHSALDACL